MILNTRLVRVDGMVGKRLADDKIVVKVNLGRRSGWLKAAS